MKTFTPKAVLERANRDKEELYGLKDFFPEKAKGRMLNTKLLEQQINETIKDPELSIIYKQPRTPK